MIEPLCFHEDNHSGNELNGAFFASITFNKIAISAGGENANDQRKIRPSKDVQRQATLIFDLNFDLHNNFNK